MTEQKRLSDARILEIVLELAKKELGYGDTASMMYLGAEIILITSDPNVTDVSLEYITGTYFPSNLELAVDLALEDPENDEYKLFALFALTYNIGQAYDQGLIDADKATALIERVYDGILEVNEQVPVVLGARYE